MCDCIERALLDADKLLAEIRNSIAEDEKQIDLLRHNGYERSKGTDAHQG